MLKLNLQAKLLLICGFLIFVASFVGITAYFATNGISKEYSSLITNTLPKEATINKFYENFLIIRMNLRNLGLPGLTKEEADRSLQLVMQGLEEVKKKQKEYESYGFRSATQKSLYDTQTKAWNEFVAVGGRVLDHFKAGTPKDLEAMTKIFFTDCPKTAEAFTTSTQNLVKYHHDEISQKSASAELISKNGSMLNILSTSIGITIGLVLAFLFSRSLARSLHRISEEITVTVEKTASGALLLSNASGQLSSASTEAAASLEETVASLEELSSMVRLNTSSAQQANSLSQKSRESAEDGDLEISKLITAMSDLAKGSKKIEEIINVIDDIAFQTNLLALNASVEAARAGEQGKGFAVVAEAVRSLAQRSAIAAKDISNLIKENVEKSEQGSRIADSSSAVLKEILTSVKKVADLNGEIAAGSAEQTNGLEQISKAMNQLDQATQGNAASSEEVAASSTSMAQQGRILSTLVQELRGLVHGKVDESHATAQFEPIEKKKTEKSSAPVIEHRNQTRKFQLAPTDTKKTTSASSIPFDEDVDDGGNLGDASGF